MDDLTRASSEATEAMVNLSFEENDDFVAGSGGFYLPGLLDTVVKDFGCSWRIRTQKLQ